MWHILPMTLSEWMSEHKRTDERLAADVGVERSYITHIRLGTKTPSLRVAARLQELTGIPAASFAGPVLRSARAA